MTLSSAACQDCSTASMRSGCSPETDDKLKFLLGHIDKAVADFVGDAEQFDDLTMMCLSYHGQDNE